MEGNLIKWTNYIEFWKERHFVIKGPVMSYMIPDENSNKPKRKFFLGLAEVTEPELEENEKDEDFAFNINTGADTFYLKAKSKEEKEKWLKEIKIGIVKGKKLLTNNTDEKFEKFKTLYEQKIKNFYIKNKYYFNILRKIDNIIKFIEGKEPLKEYKTPKINNKMRSSVQSKKLKSKKVINSKNNNNLSNSNNDISKFTETGFLLKGEEFFDIDDTTPLKDNTQIRKTVNPTNKNSLQLIPNVYENKNKNSFYDPLYDYEKRTTLPSECKNISFNIIGLFKDAIGKDLNKFAMPVFLNEPLSSLQKLCENFQYADLLNKAAKETNQFLRLAYVACFCIGGYSSDPHRTKKFFNPILFETYEYIDNNLNFRYFAEQVSHHPAISAYYAEGEGWNIYSNNNSKVNMQISGNMIINNKEKAYVNFTEFNDKIYYTKPLYFVGNFFFGELSTDIYDKVEVKNNEGDECIVNIVKSDGKKIGELSGVVKDIFGSVKFKIEGNWLDSIKVINNETKTETVIWKRIQNTGKEFYYFSPICFDLNNLTEKMKKELPQTDSRFRGDQRLMEYQKIDEAAQEKIRLEEKQRKERKKNEKEGIKPTPRYFEETYDDITGELVYQYKGNYFENRRNHNFKNLPDLFGK